MPMECRDRLLCRPRGVRDVKSAFPLAATRPVVEKLRARGEERFGHIYGNP